MSQYPLESMNLGLKHTKFPVLAKFLNSLYFPCQGIFFFVIFVIFPCAVGPCKVKLFRVNCDSETPSLFLFQQELKIDRRVHILYCVSSKNETCGGVMW